MAVSISDLTLDEVVQHLVTGAALAVAGGGEFSLPLQDSRNLLAFYNQNREKYWNPDKRANILDGEIDALLNALDTCPKIAAPATQRTGQQKCWKLVRITAHRFRGLHRHCDSTGADPEIFTLDLGRQATLFRGFNGAGKTSLINAVCWCLTGFGHRSQGLPAPLHEPITVQVAGDAEGSNATTTYELPPIVPIPTDRELRAVGGQPRIDTWVHLTFRSVDDDTEVEVERRLTQQGRRSFRSDVVGLSTLGVSGLALQVGTLMPGIAAATRSDDRTTLSQAVSSLTGLHPLAHFGNRSSRLHDHLVGKYPRKAKDDKKQYEKDAGERVTTLQDFLTNAQGLTDLISLTVPNESAPTEWKNNLRQADEILKRFEDQAAADARLILGDLQPLKNGNDIGWFERAIKDAEICFSNAALKSLPGMQIAIQLGDLDEADLAAAEAELRDIEHEAADLVAHLSDAGRADRMRLYGLVARWQDAVHPDRAFTNCPVCERDLLRPDAIPIDAVLDMSVAQALEDARQADAALLKTMAEWERDTKRDLRNRLPEPLRRFVDDDLPDDLAMIYEKALSEDVFRLEQFPALLRPMAGNIASLCAAAWKDAPAREPVPGVDLPAEIPDNENLRTDMHRVRKAIAHSRYRTANAEFIRAAITKVLGPGADEAAHAANDRTIKGQLSVLKSYRDAAAVFTNIRRQLGQIKEICEKWADACARIEKLERAATAVEPFLKFPELVDSQVAGMISDLQDKTKFWSQKMYRAHFTEAPQCSGLDAENSNDIRFLATQGKHRVEAHHVMNASAIRSFLTAFVLALWQQIWSRSGGISIVLLDDPQDLFDPANVMNLAAVVPELIAEGINPIIVSNDFGFISAIADFVAKDQRTMGAAQTETWEISAISTTKSTMSLAPMADEIRARCKVWQETNPNDTGLARKFVYPVRVRIETKLWDLLASASGTLSKATLGDLLGKIENIRNHGEQPFTEEPFRRLLALPALRAKAEFRTIINKAHHGEADQITPVEAETVKEHYEGVFLAIDACWRAYERFMGRLPPGAAMAEARETLPDLTPAALRSAPIPIIGRLAARAVGAPLATVNEATDQLDLPTFLGTVALFTLRAPTLGLVAFPGQTLIASLTAEVKNGDLAVVRTPERTYARRIGLDKSDRSRMALETIPSTNPHVPPTHFVRFDRAHLSKVIGVLFDNTRRSKSQDEAIAVDRSPILDQVVAAASVGGDSAFPVALNKGHVLLGEAPDHAGPDGGILAIVTRADAFSQEYSAYLKRLGKALPGSQSVYYLETVGQSGEGEFVQFPATGTETTRGIPVVEQARKVLGSLF